jgi:hypothetical protein
MTIVRVALVGMMMAKRVGSRTRKMMRKMIWMKTVTELGLREGSAVSKGGYKHQSNRT